MDMRSAIRRWVHSLGARLLATYVAALLLTVAGIIFGIWMLLCRHEDRMTRFDLQNEARLLADSLQFDRNGTPFVMSLPSELAWIYQVLASDLKYRVLDAAGDVILSSEPGGRALVPDGGGAFEPGAALFKLERGSQTLNVMTVAVGSKADYYLQAASSKRLAVLVRGAFGHVIVANALHITLIAMIVFSVVVYYTLRRALRPLREASLAAARIDPRNLSARIAVGDPPVEFAPVIDAFNQMLDRLEKGFNVQQSFLAAAAHELKTPLALVRAQIELDDGGERRLLLRDLDYMARQVHQLLHLAEVSEDRNFILETVDVAAVAEQVADYLQRLAEARSVHLDIRCVDSSTQRADEGALHVLLKNLLENAIQHSPTCGVVSVTIESKQLAVRDEGPGIAAADLPHLFTRFWRGSERLHDGAGLGLAICREIATAHGWRLSAANSVRGAEFVLPFIDTTSLESEAPVERAVRRWRSPREHRVSAGQVAERRAGQ
jgi:signal transduction histidine kinase